MQSSIPNYIYLTHSKRLYTNLQYPISTLMSDDCPKIWMSILYIWVHRWCIVVLYVSFMLAHLRLLPHVQAPRTMSSSWHPSRTFLVLPPRRCCWQRVSLIAAAVVVLALVWHGSSCQCKAPRWTPPKRRQNKLPVVKESIIYWIVWMSGLGQGSWHGDADYTST